MTSRTLVFLCTLCPNCFGFLVVFGFLMVVKMFRKLALQKMPRRILKEIRENMKKQAFLSSFQKHSAIIVQDCSLKILKAANQRTAEFSTGFLTETFLSLLYIMSLIRNARHTLFPKRFL
jgi:hypothetical protein